MQTFDISHFRANMGDVIKKEGTVWNEIFREGPSKEVTFEQKVVLRETFSGR